MALVEHNHQMALVILPLKLSRQLWRPCLFCLGNCFSFVLLASVPFHRFNMSAHGDCKSRDEWLVQDKYKEWVVKDGDPRLPRFKLKFWNLPCKSRREEFEEIPVPTPAGWILCSWAWRICVWFEKVRVGVGTCACVIHMLWISLFGYNKYKE